MPLNNFLPFTPTDTGTNLLSQSDYATDPERSVGNQPGIARAKLVNKALRQATYIAGQFAQFLADTMGVDVLDDNVPARLLGQTKGALTTLPPVYNFITTGSGNYNRSNIFFIATGSATTGATYTNNGNTFTVVDTVASGTQIKMTGDGEPSVAGTLTKTGGTGDATLTFYSVRKPIYYRVRLQGGGGGGAGSGTASGGNGTDGNDTTFGSSLLEGEGGKGALFQSDHGDGGAASLGSGPVGIAVKGNPGFAGDAAGAGLAAPVSGGGGGTSGFGGGGGWAGGYGSAGLDGLYGSGGGGGGANAAVAIFSGGGGGAGGWVDAFIYSPAAVYAYVVGAAGTGGASGTSGQPGGDGGEGAIEVTEYYQ